MITITLGKNSVPGGVENLKNLELILRLNLVIRLCIPTMTKLMALRLVSGLKV